MTKPKNHELEEWLSEFNIEYPDEDKIDQTIMQLYQYVPKRKNNRYPVSFRHLCEMPIRNLCIFLVHFGYLTLFI